ncbi:hypothetical protein chiPu_0033951, partial [Chiloscyllium punctatum]|nr:hypothetical protein [Chiloscyllium punctatum]
MSELSSKAREKKSKVDRSVLRLKLQISCDVPNPSRYSA